MWYGCSQSAGTIGSRTPFVVGPVRSALVVALPDAAGASAWIVVARLELGAAASAASMSDGR